MAILWLVISICCVGLVWLFLGRWISLPLDRFFRAGSTALEVSPMAIDPERFTLGSRSWPFARSGPGGVRVQADAGGHAILSSGDGTFTLGPVVKRWSCGGGGTGAGAGMQYEFVPEAGDVVTFTRDHSRLSWPTPFHFSIMGVPRASWRRRSAYHLRWTKPGGRTLEVVWRDEQGFYAGAGWRDGFTDRLSRVRVRVRVREK